MLDTDPRHGTNAGYCAHRAEGDTLCYPCRVAHANYETTRHRLIAYGRWNPWVDAQPARQHVQDLMAANMGIVLIARAAHAPSSKITHLIYGRQGNPPPTKIRPAYANAILAVEPMPRRVPALGAKRRIGALAAIGWPQTTIARELGWHQRQLNHVFNRETFIERRTHEAIAAVYDRLHMAFPPENTPAEKFAASKARNTAKRHGYPTGFAWDDIDNDLAPTGVFTGTIAQRQGPSRASVDHARVERLLAGEWTLAPEATRAERAAVLARWPGTLNDLERRTGWRVDRYHLPNGAA